MHKIDKTGGKPGSLDISEEIALLREKKNMKKKPSPFFWLSMTARQTVKIKFKRELHRKTMLALGESNPILT